MPELSDFTEDNTGIYGITDIHQWKGAERLINRFESFKKVIQIIIFLALVSFGMKNAFRNNGKSWFKLMTR